jgi:hypothetical protein
VTPRDLARYPEAPPQAPGQHFVPEPFAEVVAGRVADDLAILAENDWPGFTRPAICGELWPYRTPVGGRVHVMRLHGGFVRALVPEAGDPVEISFIHPLEDAS